MAKKSITIVYDEDRLTVGDIIELEEGDTKRRMQVFAKCVQDEGGAWLPVPEAYERILGLTIAQIREVTQQFTEAAAAGNDPN